MTTHHQSPAENGPASAPPGESAKSGQNLPLTAKQEAAAFLLATGRPVKEAAAECGAGERSLRRWLAEHKGFIRRVREFRTGVLAEAVGRLATLGGKAADTLGRLLDDESPGVRLRAAATVLGTLATGYKVLEERQACELAEKALRYAEDLDAEWARLKAERQRLDAERQRPGGNGAGGPYGHGR
jgi:hypothetical protein